MHYKLTYLLLFAALLSFNISAEEWDEDDDLELFFSTRQKSTISDFPLQEIPGDELSEAAISGALRPNSSPSQSIKPAYQQEKEADDKKKAGAVLKEDELLKLNNDFPLDPFPVSGPEFQQPIYQQPNGRTYGGHHTHTIERP